MGLLTPRTGPFHRIGDRYATLIDLDHFLGRSALEDSWMTKPPRNILTKENELEVQVAMPGFKKEDIKLEIHDGFLYISAKRTIDQADVEYVEKQVPDAIDNQVIELGKDVDEVNITAELDNGMLIIRMPRSSQPKKASKSIQVI